MPIRRQNLPLNALRTFEVLGRHRHMQRAAQELGVTHAAVSHQLRLLEDLVGLPLFRRKGGLQLTPEGNRLMPILTAAFDKVEAALNFMNPMSMTGQITVASTTTLCAAWLAPHLHQFLNRHPEIDIHLIPTGIPDTAKPMEGIAEADLTINYGETYGPGRRTVLLSKVEFFPVCSPKLLAVSRPRRPAELANYDLLYGESDEDWEWWFAKIDQPQIRPTRKLMLRDTHIALEYARSGHGIAMGDQLTTKVGLDDGSLVPIFDFRIAAPHDVYIITHHEAEMSIRTKEFETWLRADLLSQ
jgi:LysR family transcriptional regulator, glycine cleavage system transcriptional activator